MIDLREAMRAFDRFSPDDELLHRARRGPARPQLPPRPGRADRIVAGITATVVFVLAGAFAWRAFTGPRDDRPPRPAVDVVALGADGSTLWPERTEAELAQAQRRVDEGALRWRLDPEAVAHSFAERVLGWWPRDSYALTIEERASPFVAHLVRDETTCPSPLPDDEARGVPPCIPGAQDITLVQPVTSGPAGIWAVSDVRSPSVAVELVAGQIVVNGSRIDAHVEVPEGQRSSWTTTIGGDGDDVNCFGSASGRAIGPDLEIEVSIHADAELGSECGVAAPGYVVIQTSGITSLANPLNADSSPYTAVTAVPIVVSIPENEQPAGTAVYEDPTGWKLNHPADWVVVRGSVDGRRRTWISNMEIFEDSPGAIESVVPPPEAVVLSIAEAPPEVLRDDSSFPLSIDDFEVLPGLGRIRLLEFRGNGAAYVGELVAGEAASQGHVDAMADVIASIRFPSIPAGRERNGWLSLGHADVPAGRGVPVWAGGPFGVGYLLEASFGMYLLDLDPDGCGEGQNQTWDDERGQILIECPDGAEVRYERTGEPVAGNPPGFDERLRAHLVITAWDGTLLVAKDERVGLGADVDSLQS
jgi:hypothetical protein